MRRSVRRVVKPRTERAPSPSTSEKSTDFVTPAPSPPPEVAVRNYGTPGLRADGAPKRPMNAFILFSNEMRSVLADQNPELSNAAVSVLLGQRWREMPTTEKAGFVSAAKRIKEDFHLQHPDAKTRCVQRKGKRAKLDHAGSRGPRAGTSPPSLQALAMVGSRLNHQVNADEFQRCDSASTYTQGPVGSSYGGYDAPGRRSQDDDDDYYQDEEELRWGDEGDGDGAVANAPSSDAPSLLEQLCCVAETEHTAAAKMLSALGAC